MATDILPGESIGLDVSFTRADTAMVDDQLRITSDDPLGNETVTISLSAHSVAPALVLETDLLDFSNASGDSTVTVALSNTGTDTLNISGLSVSPAVFSQVLSDSILEPGAAANLLVSFSPPSRGYWEGDLVITSDNYQASESSLELKALSYTSTGFDLGNVPVGLPSGHVYTLENTGNTDLSVDSLSVDQGYFSIEPSENITVTASGDQEVAVTVTPLAVGSVTGNMYLHVPSLEEGIAVGSFSGNAMDMPQAVFSASAMHLVLAPGDHAQFSIVLSNDGDFTLDYTVTVDATSTIYTWLSIVESGQVPGNSTISIPVSLAQTENMSAGSYTGYLYFGTNTGTDLGMIVANTDTVTITLNLMSDDTQLADTTVTVPSGNSEPIDFADESGQPMGIMVDFEHSDGGSVTIQSIGSQPPMDETPTWEDPDGLITDPAFPNKYFEISTDITGDFWVDIGLDYTMLVGIDDPQPLRLAKRSGYAGTSDPWTVIAVASTEINSTDGLV
ncbi:MAG: choice-of-anchor D domain-containing protein, partial [Pseudomonadales bacterium]|nr:choice-of-anchor D domain-containing protein [Pseudomonadales bacterium]